MSDENALIRALTYATVNGKKPRNSDRIMPGELMNARALLEAAQNIPVAGDVLSGGMAVYDAAKGDYPSALMNALGVLPFVSAAPLAAMGLINKAAKAKGITTEASTLSNALKSQQGAIVYHGSPHKFDKFDMSKIGTGEGAQAYGHGLYMAESPAVAQEYAEKLAAERFIDFPGGAPSTEAEKRIAESLLSRAKTTQTGHRETAISDAFKQFANPPKHMLGDPSTPKWAMPSEKEIARAIENMEAAKRLGMPSLSDSSQLYKADIPDEAVSRFLDWDKPLSQQHPDVQKALGKFAIPDKNMTGQEINAFIRNTAADQSGKVGTSPSFYKSFDNEASRLLNEAGIPGIRYLDGRSRGTGAGTSNFVLFDDQMPRILEVNGQATGAKPWKPGEYK